MWRRWWAIVGCRRVVVPSEWQNTKTEISAVIQLFERHKERYDELESYYICCHFEWAA